MNPNLEIILPVYNEEDNLRPLYDEITAALEGQDLEWQVLFVDDGSSDNSREIIKELSANNSTATGLLFKENNGQSAAFAAGFEQAGGEMIVTMDADRQNDPADIPKIIAPLTDYDMVAGYRANRRDSWLRRKASNIANKVRNWYTGDDIIDTGCSLKAFRLEVVKKIPVFDGMHRFLPTLARMKGYSVTQVATNHRPRTAGETKYSNFGRLRKTIWDLWAVRWMQKRSINYEIESKL